MKIYKLELEYETPEESLLASILKQSIEDVFRLPKVKPESAFNSLKNDLWGFFQGDLFYWILAQLEIPTDLKEWAELKEILWKTKYKK